MKSIKGILSDIDGTLHFKGAPVPGTIEAVEKLRKKGIKMLFFTNTDSKTPKNVYKSLIDYGFKVKEAEVFTPIIALKEFLKDKSGVKLYIVTTEEIKEEFQEYHLVKGSEVPDYVIVGDFQDNWDVNRLNEAFRYVIKHKAILLGTQGNKYYLDVNGEPVIDTGSFVNMIAEAANIKPIIFGKPSKDYFLQALEKLKLSAEDVIVVGDDVETDILGAQNSHLRGILVKTGKGQFFNASEGTITPYKVIDSFSSLNELI
ncbi:MAG: HAD-IIA family hydrolase [Candidatus Lokiarchaeota archaeon]|nr:HAD-IIA family hydrolase [Candidatus Lokiarchaeota archaeon]